MLTSPQVLSVAGFASVGGAVVLLATGGSAALAAVLLLGARALFEPASRSWVTLSAPIWGAAVVVAAWRAGSGDLGDISGAHAVLGSGLLRGEPAAVISLWALLLACLLVTGLPEGQPARVAFAVQAVLLAALVTGPQVGGAADAAAWIAVVPIAIAAALAGGWVGPARRAMLARALAVSAVVAGALA